MFNFFSTPAAWIALPANVLPFVLTPNEHADWYLRIRGERDFITERAEGNPDHLRARIHLADERSATSLSFKLKDA